MAWDNFMIRNKFKNVELIKTASLKQNAFREAVSDRRQIWQRVIHTRCHIFAL